MSKKHKQESRDTQTIEGMIFDKIPETSADEDFGAVGEPTIGAIFAKAKEDQAANAAAKKLAEQQMADRVRRAQEAQEAKAPVLLDVNEAALKNRINTEKPAPNTSILRASVDVGAIRDQISRWGVLLGDHESAKVQKARNKMNEAATWLTDYLDSQG